MSTAVTRAQFVKSASVAGALGVLGGIASQAGANCAIADEAAASENAGNLYSATAMGKDGELAVALTFDGTSITSIQVPYLADDNTIGHTAAEDVCKRILAEQNVEVDAATGATITSMAVKQAAVSALEAAGADMASFQKGSDAIATEDKEQKEAESYDIVIVGSGFGGTGAAIAAARAGSQSVLVLEKQAYTGGCSRVIGGWISMWNSPYNDECGLNNTFEDYRDPLLNRDPTQAANDERDEEWLRNMYEIGGDVFTYYHDHDFPMNPASGMPGNYEGNTIQFCNYGHEDVNFDTDQQAIYESMEGMALELGVEFRTLSKVTGLIHDGSTVTGVRVEDRTSTYEVQAKKVILATGGFQWNQEYMEKYCPSYKDVTPFAMGGCTGDAITMTRDLDVPVMGEDGASCFAGLDSVVGYMGRIGWLAQLPQLVINAEGENLGINGPTKDVIVKQTGCCTYGIFDGKTPYMDRLTDAVKRGLATKYTDLYELAEGLGQDYGQLQFNIQRNGMDEKGPFHVVVQKPCNIMTLPGLATDPLCRVLNSAGEQVGNLYAAGCCILGNVFSDTPESDFNNAYVGTTNSVTEAILSGSVCGKDAVESL